MKGLLPYLVCEFHKKKDIHTSHSAIKTINFTWYVRDVYFLLFISLRLNIALTFLVLLAITKRHTRWILGCIKWNSCYWLLFSLLLAVAAAAASVRLPFL